MKPLEANGAALAKTAMFLTAFLLTQKALASKAQIKIDHIHLGKTTALAVTVALPLAGIDYTPTHLHAINSITRLILEGISFLVVYSISLRLFKIIERGDFDILRRALPHQLEKTTKMIESFIAYRTLQ